MSDKREALIEEGLKRWCAKRGLLCLKLHLAGQRGFPDRTIIGPDGLIVFLELKTTEGQTSRTQRVWLNRLSRLGFPARVVRSTEEAIEVIKGCGG